MLKYIIKKPIKFIIAFLILSLSFVYANSGPTYWQGDISSDILIVDNNSPIEVKREDLTFDFSDEANNSYSVQALVTAEYEMNNPTDEAQFVQMAFPFVESLNNINYDDIKITVDDKELSYDVYLGHSINRNSFKENKDINFDFKEIVNTISNDIYEAKNFSKDEIGKLYSIEIYPTTDDGIDFTVDFIHDHEKTNIITNNFHSLNRDNDKVRIASGCYEPQTVEILVLGEDIDLSIKGYTIGSIKKESNLFTYEILEKEIDVKSYLLNYIKSYYDEHVQRISDIQLYNVYASALDKYFEYNLGLCSEHDMSAESYNERIITLVYNVEFPSTYSQKISVSYKTDGTMDKRDTLKPQYSFDYILNPAKNWNNFNNLNIKIITPEEAPFIIDSSIYLIKTNDNIYTATFEILPEEDLSFTLYAHEKVTLFDKIQGQLNRSFGYFAPIVVWIVGIIILIVTISIVRKIKRNTKN